MPAPTVSAEIRERVHADALLIGLRPAARKHGINERTVCTWAHRGEWKLPHVLQPFGRVKANESKARALNALAEAIDEQGEHSRAYLSSATLQASHDLAQSGGKTEGERVPYAGLLNASRSGDVVHGWQAKRQQPAAAVNVAVILPTPEEQAKLREIDSKLDAIFTLPAAKTGGGGSTLGSSEEGETNPAVENLGSA